MPSAVATLRVKEDKVDEARKLFKELQEATLADESGTLAYVFHQKKDDPRTFVVYEKYESDDAFKIHGANLRKRGAGPMGVIDGPPEIVMLEEI